ncbi:MAG: hypothetical protein DRJ08_06240 [Acidobacteria bacterium]|nr:MAG: hypothetical protein DRJ08_06240 [Acidobacteriota bacterium]
MFLPEVTLSVRLPLRIPLLLDVLSERVNPRFDTITPEFCTEGFRTVIRLLEARSLVVRWVLPVVVKPREILSVACSLVTIRCFCTICLVIGRLTALRTASLGCRLSRRGFGTMGRVTRVTFLLLGRSREVSRC